MGGMTMAMGELTAGAGLLRTFPLTWQYSMCTATSVFRGMTLSQMIGPYGEYILYVTALMMLAHSPRFYLSAEASQDP